MRLEQALQEAHEGWVRRPTLYNVWMRLVGVTWHPDQTSVVLHSHTSLDGADLAATDWEPRPAPEVYIPALLNHSRRIIRPVVQSDLNWFGPILASEADKHHGVDGWAPISLLIVKRQS